MAIGRMLNKKISFNKIINESLSSDTCRLAFTWTIPHLDRDGRINGDPTVLRSIIFPRRRDITDEQIEAYIWEWVENDLVIWYEAEGDKWLQFPKFGANQPNLRYEREAESTMPPPEEGKIIDPSLRSSSGANPDQVRSNSGKMLKNDSIVDNVGPEDCRSNSGRREENLNLREENLREFNIYETLTYIIKKI